MNIKPGDIVKLDFKKTISPENLTLTPVSKKGIILYEKIDLNSYPSYKDFKGYSKVFNNETLLVISKRGRPRSFNGRSCWHIYDVYCLMYENKTYECFSYCIQKTTEN